MLVAVLSTVLNPTTTSRDKSPVLTATPTVTVLLSSFTEYNVSSKPIVTARDSEKNK